MNIVQEYKDEFSKAAEHVKHDIAGLRTGRASPAIVEDVRVKAYGVEQPLKAVASIMVSDPKTLLIDPWDKSIVQAVDAAIRASGLGLNPVNDGKVIRLPLPELTQDRRVELIKVLHQKLEAGRIAIRQIREDVRGLVESAEKDKDIGEDEKFRQLEALELLVKETNEKLQMIGDEKEKEIRTV